MREPAAGGREPRRPLAAPLALALLLAGLAPAEAVSPHTNYMLDCMGCHTADGGGVPGKVPDMRAVLAPLSAIAAGRRYLIEVPGVAQAPLSDAELAELLNWMVGHLSATAASPRFRPFTPEEVASYRSTPLIELAGVRRRLLAHAFSRSSGAGGR